ncbi:MAG TPA: 50S ribosomal protein L18 [Firmicutes bacterium]|uniref:Large ribosomal subunit protein uL18 n=1 Tax=candidate division TA06 bacterium TaxID=2250710 RepID=A0A660S4Y6_UNCT6|nr:50S ribosomal protein L18 [candidate division WOR-3 bacterium]RKX64694.1 MAG: 50S ribosomal protein L18 [candidate division TA06 bacterium]HFD05201.1 50S ribosomal protein L18 [Bacillota bacterium]
MDKNREKRLNRLKRHKRIRLHLTGTPERPRLVVFRSLKNIYGQIVDDINGKTIVSASSNDKDLRDGLKGKKKVEISAIVGEALAKKAIEKGIKKIVFDRGGYRYHGRVKSFAESCRKAGLEF